MNYLFTYFLIGFIWLCIWDVLIQKMPSNGTRVRCFLFWPVTLGAFIVGIIQSFIHHSKQ